MKVLKKAIAVVSNDSYINQMGVSRYNNRYGCSCSCY